MGPYRTYCFQQGCPSLPSCFSYHLRSLADSHAHCFAGVVSLSIAILPDKLRATSPRPLSQLRPLWLAFDWFCSMTQWCQLHTLIYLSELLWRHVYQQPQLFCSVLHVFEPLCSPEFQMATLAWVLAQTSAAWCTSWSLSAWALKSLSQSPVWTLWHRIRAQSQANFRHQ